MSTSTAGGASDRRGRAESLRRLLSDLERTRRRVGVDHAATADPLFVLSGVLVLWGIVGLVQQPNTDAAYREALAEGRVVDGGFSMVGWHAVVDDLFFGEFWLYAGPTALAVIGFLVARRSRRSGAGPGAGAWLMAAGLVLFVLGVLGRWGVWPMPVDGPPDSGLGHVILTGYSLLHTALPGSLMAVAVLFVAWRQHDLALGLWAAACGLVLALAGFFVIGIRMYDFLRLLGVDSARWEVSWDSLAVVAMGVALLVAALHYRRAGSEPPI